MRDKQRYTRLNRIGTGTYHTITNHHDNLSGRSCIIGIIQVIKDFIRALNPEGRLTIVRHKLRTNRHIGCEIRIAGGAEGEIVLRPTSVGRRVPATQLVTIRRKGRQLYRTIHRERLIVRHCVTIIRNIECTVRRTHETHLNLLDEAGVHVQIGIRIATQRHRSRGNSPTDMSSTVPYQFIVSIVPTCELVSSISYGPEMVRSCLLRSGHPRRRSRRSGTGAVFVCTGCRFCAV